MHQNGLRHRQRRTMTTTTRMMRILWARAMIVQTSTAIRKRRRTGRHPPNGASSAVCPFNPTANSQARPFISFSSYCCCLCRCCVEALGLRQRQPFLQRTHGFAQRATLVFGQGEDAFVQSVAAGHQMLIRQFRQSAAARRWRLRKVSRVVLVATILLLFQIAFTSTTARFRIFAEFLQKSSGRYNFGRKAAVLSP
jgi:hypothetical protein